MGNIVAPLWADCSACTRLLVVGYPALSVVLEVAKRASYPMIADYGFDCSLDNVCHNYCIWTMITSGFYRPFAGGISFLFMLFEIYMGMILLPVREKDLGSSAFLLWVMLMNTCVSAVFLMVMFGISLTGDEGAWERPNQGFWPLIFICLSLKCLSDLGGSTSFWGVVNIPNKWYPLALFGFFCLLSQAIVWNVGAALVIGYGYGYLRPERLLPSRVTLNGMEQRCCGPNGRSFLGTYWIRAQDTAGYELESGDRRYATLSDFGRSGQAQQLQTRGDDSGSSTQGGRPSGNFAVFAGSGNTLGDGSTEAAPTPALARPPEPTPVVATTADAAREPEPGSTAE